MRAVFSPEARKEFDEAERYFENQVPGLGARFRAEARASLKRILTWPMACPIERGSIRRLVVNRFPYKLLYSIEGDHVYVIAVAHQHREPMYWQGRAVS